MKKRGPGQPPKPPELSRTKKVEVLLTPAEREALRAMEAQMCLSASEIIRQALRREHGAFKRSQS